MVSLLLCVSHTDNLCSHGSVSFYELPTAALWLISWRSLKTTNHKTWLIHYYLLLLLFHFDMNCTSWLCYDYVSLIGDFQSFMIDKSKSSLSPISIPTYRLCVCPYKLYFEASDSWLQMFRVSFAHWTVNESLWLVQINLMSSFMSHNRSTQSLVNSLFWLIQREPERREACLKTGRSHGDTTHHSGVQEKKLVNGCLQWNTVYQSMQGLLSFQQLYYI